MDAPDSRRAEIDSLAQWWADAGVDTFVADTPFDWLKAPEPAPVAAAPPAAKDKSAPAQPVPEVPSLPALPDQLPLLVDWLKASDALPYAAANAPRICPSGDPASGLMILAAMPSGEDCAAGTLLSGAEGRLFDRMLAAIGRSRETAYLAAFSCLRPTGGRFDAKGAADCTTIAKHHVDLVRPQVLLLLGDACSRGILGLGVAQARGRVHRLELPGGVVNVISTLAPDFLLGQPPAKALAWSDLLLLMETMTCTSGSSPPS